MNKTEFNPMAEVFKYLAISILFCFVGYAFGKAFIPESVVMVANFIFIFVVLGLLILCLLSRKEIIPDRFSMNWVYLFTFINGILLYPILQMYISGLGSQTVIIILLVTALIFFILSMVAKKENSDKYLRLGNILLIGLVILILLSIVSIFIGFKTFNILVSVFSVVIFCGYILYDVSLIKYEIVSGDINDSKDLSMHVLNLYLDFINIFLDLLNLVYNFRD
ncbi:MAG: Bax inhibitor-1 family protein [Paeniclostridium sordellii]|uniref:US12 family protein n=1 Tax=Paeniclostridium hominis TaxID=2764329 RepID=A0ABR7K5W0_9FIRM|nr:US12 family protein [Paeniclostridium hominis]MDU2591396.1 Bax inhibitor-1 family protein [Paeniclostridium sordellii]